MKILFYTFGCRVNQYETEALRTALLRRGATQATTDCREADLCLVNTCSVTREADRKALRFLRRVRRLNPLIRLVLTGCYATRAPEEILRAFPDAWIVHNHQKQNLPALLGCTVTPDPPRIQGFAGRSRAFIKIQDGCNMRCAYCIIPKVRPQMSHRTSSEILAEVRGLLEQGVREIVFCGVRLGRYLDDLPDGTRLDLVRLLEKVLNLPGAFRVRLSSLEITDLTDRLLELLQRYPKRFCPSFHLPLQSGADQVLKRMRRWYTVAFYAKRLEALRRVDPEAGIFTDVMVGFPGEDEEAFKSTRLFLRQMDFSGLHVFRYSPRPETEAFRAFPTPPENLLQARAAQLRRLDRQLRHRFAQSSVGKMRELLLEECQAEGEWEGLTEHFLRVRFRGANPGRIFPATITSLREDLGIAEAGVPQHVA
ncbi:MAG: tRNA (N(6)-L-threonylcarbamoyladenosine(37)-C(2))-methylthiotransferase MtaB [Elusimicrobia bacterium]|nr:tRNA (N(6)-L-threonylcarbamoyladenosine(37)-C(2))-methylthiotransferase MtaB [Elusimicrobiota bacterium]